MTAKNTTRQVTVRLRHLEAQRITTQIESKYPNLPTSVRKAMSSWIRQIFRRHPKMSILLVRTLAASIAQTLSSESEPLHYLGVRDCLRFAVRILSKDCDESTFAAVMSSLKCPSPDWARALNIAHLQALHRFHGRRNSAVSTANLFGHITQFIRYVSQVTGHPVAPVRFDAIRNSDRNLDPATAARSEIHAYCDGQTLHLPPCFAVARRDETRDSGSDQDLAQSQSRELNAIFVAYYLSLHEFLHLALGSWKFSFKSRRGKLIFRQLRPWRSIWKSQQSDGISMKLRVRLQREGILVAALKTQKASDLVNLWRHFPNSQLAQWIFNAVEDGRIESTVERHWPGLWQIHRVIQDSYATEVRPTAACQTPLEQLVNAIGMLAADRVMRVKISREHIDAFEKAQRWLTRQKKKPRRSVYDSVRTTIKLYKLLEQAAGDAQVLGELETFRPDVDGEEIAVRMELAERQDSLDVYDQSNRGRDGHFDVKDKGIWLPEWDRRTLIEQKTHVSLKLLSSSQPQPQLPPLTLAFPPVELNRMKARLKGSRHWHDYGRFLATDRLAMQAPYRSAGVIPFPINYDFVADRIPLKVTILIDLSISMEAPRHCLDGDTPLSRAIQGASWVTRHLEALGVEVAGYGACDGGPRMCQLFEVPRPVSRFLPAVRGVGVGGFRVGAFIRAISRNPVELGMRPFQGRHILMIFTDTDRHYISMSNESLFETLQKSNCPACSSRDRCKVESGDGAINSRNNELDWLFAPPAYELADIDHAVSETSCVEVVINYFGPRLPYAGRREPLASIFHCNSGDIWPTVVRESLALKTTPSLSNTPQILAGR